MQEPIRCTCNSSWAFASAICCLTWSIRCSLSTAPNFPPGGGEEKSILSFEVSVDVWTRTCETEIVLSYPACLNSSVNRRFLFPRSFELPDTSWRIFENFGYLHLFTTMPHLHGKGGPQQFCGKCDEECIAWEGIFCDVCGNWYHVKCEQLEIQILQAFKELPEAPYICRSCRCDEKGAFSYEQSINRLHKAAKQGIEKLYIYVERERLFMKEDLSYHRMRTPKYSSDVQAQALLQEYCPTEKKNAAKTTKDNNTLFSAVSVALTGNEKLATELRVRCCIEMVVYEAFYKWQDKYSQLSKCAPDYVESCLNCATPNEDSCVWTLSALASVVRRHIESIYPPVNGKMDRAIQTLNTVFAPRNKVDDGENLKIFWGSSKKTNLTPGSWVPDVFVPLVDMPIVPLSPMVASPYLTPSRVSGRVRKPSAKVMAITSPKTKNELKVVVENTVIADDDDMDNDPDFEMPADFTLEPTDDEPFLDRYRHEDYDFNWMDKYKEDAVGGKPLKGTAFLPAQEVFNILSTETDVCRSIPAGRKEDVCFVVDNSRNMRYKNRRNYFQDDCGRYNQRSGTTCKSYYLMTADHILQPMIKYKDKYCKESRRVSLSGASSPRGRGRPPGRGRGRGRGRHNVDEQKVTKWIPMNPQPDEDKVVVLHRYYSVLEVDPSYKRRISWFLNLPETVERGHDVFLVEYLTKPGPGMQLPKSRKRGHPPATPVIVGNSQSADPGSDIEMNSQVADAVTGEEAEAMESQKMELDAGKETEGMDCELTDNVTCKEVEEVERQALERDINKDEGETGKQMKVQQLL